MSNFGMNVLRKAALRSDDIGVSARSDLRLVDYAVIGPITAQLLLQHEPGRATPTVRQIEAWCHERFGNKIRVKTETAKSYEREPAVTIYASLNVPHRPLSDASAMQRVGGLDSYMDAETNNVWDVRENESGTKFLVARTDDNLDEIFSLVKTRGHGRAFVASLADIREAACMCEVGDTVKYIDGDNVGRGKISAKSGENVTITANGGKVTVDKRQVVEILTRNSSDINSERVTLQDYFAKAFGNEEFASALTNKLSTDSVGPAKV